MAYVRHQKGPSAIAGAGDCGNNSQCAQSHPAVRRRLGISRGDIEIDLKTRCVCRFGKKLRMSERSFDLLVYLAEYPGRVRRRREIQEFLWGNAPDVELRSVDTEISRLRRSLNLWKSLDPIISVRDRGYTFDGSYAARVAQNGATVKKLKL